MGGPCGLGTKWCGASLLGASGQGGTRVHPGDLLQRPPAQKALRMRLQVHPVPLRICSVLFSSALFPLRGPRLNAGMEDHSSIERRVSLRGR